MLVQRRPHYKRPLKGRLSEATRARMSVNASGANNPFYGRTHSQASRAKNRASHKGTPRTMLKRVPRSEAVRRQISETLKITARRRRLLAALRGKARSWRRGKPLSPEWRAHTPESGILSREREEIVGTALKALPRLQRELVVGVFFTGQTIHEVAARLEIDLTEAGNALTGAVVALRKNQQLQSLLE